MEKLFKNKIPVTINLGLKLSTTPSCLPTFFFFFFFFFFLEIQIPSLLKQNGTFFQKNFHDLSFDRSSEFLTKIMPLGPDPPFFFVHFD